MSYSQADVHFAAAATPRFDYDSSPGSEEDNYASSHCALSSVPDTDSNSGEDECTTDSETDQEHGYTHADVSARTEVENVEMAECTAGPETNTGDEEMREHGVGRFYGSGIQNSSPFTMLPPIVPRDSPSSPHSMTTVSSSSVSSPQHQQQQQQLYDNFGQRPFSLQGTATNLLPPMQTGLPQQSRQGMLHNPPNSRLNYPLTTSSNGAHGSGTEQHKQNLSGLSFSDSQDDEDEEGVSLSTYDISRKRARTRSSNDWNILHQGYNALPYNSLHPSTVPGHHRGVANGSSATIRGNSLVNGSATSVASVSAPVGQHPQPSMYSTTNSNTQYMRTVINHTHTPESPVHTHAPRGGSFAYSHLYAPSQPPQLGSSLMDLIPTSPTASTSGMGTPIATSSPVSTSFRSDSTLPHFHRSTAMLNNATPARGVFSSHRPTDTVPQRPSIVGDNRSTPYFEPAIGTVSYIGDNNVSWRAQTHSIGHNNNSSNSSGSSSSGSSSSSSSNNNGHLSRANHSQQTETHSWQSNGRVLPRSDRERVPGLSRPMFAIPPSRRVNRTNNGTSHFGFPAFPTYQSDDDVDPSNDVAESSDNETNTVDSIRDTRGRRSGFSFASERRGRRPPVPPPPSVPSPATSSNLGPHGGLADLSRRMQSVQPVDYSAASGSNGGAAHFGSFTRVSTRDSSSTPVTRPPNSRHNRRDSGANAPASSRPGGSRRDSHGLRFPARLFENFYNEERGSESRGRAFGLRGAPSRSGRGGGHYHPHSNVTHHLEFLHHLLEDLDHDELLEFWPVGSGIAANPANYLDDDEFDPSYEALIRLQETIGDVKPKGVAEDVVGSLPTKLYVIGAVRRSDQEESCRICLTEYEINERLRTLPCNHDFHLECIDKWFKNSDKCPICRRSVLNENENEAERASAKNDHLC